ncbi:hypothetical protein [Actinomadura rupiterrae]|uniref:hypothetical protein n=1 Tax=Actinomadura rupiterrae TaxID=559627 RepID=UPI0020A499D3|nr:hypothetical protein [Actinomadura rupiterrae]MCP2340247.1 hypothetical protein [Actinomadura rupiterrae]
MAKIVDYGVFADRMKRAGGRWDLLREFQEEWGYAPPPIADDEDHELLLARAASNGHKAYVQELMNVDEDDREGVDPSVSIPAALGEWWTLPFNSFVHNPGFYGSNPEFPPTMRPDPSGYGVADGLQEGSDLLPADADRRLVAFMAENQYCNEWGYLAAEAHLDDPRVLVTFEDEESDEDGQVWMVQAPSLSRFFLQFTAVCLPMTLGWSAWLDGDGDEADRLRASLAPLGFEHPWRELDAETHLYGGPDVLVYDMHGGDGNFDVVGRNREALEALGRRFGLDWDARLKEPSHRVSA